MNKRNALKTLAAGSMLASTLALMTACNSESAKPSFNAIDLTGSKEYGQNFSMPDQHGQRRTMADFQGKVTLLFFGYTYCPDVCPTTLADLRAVYPSLKTIASNSQVVFISADPQRDDSARLKSYTDFFEPEFKAATGPHSALFPLVRNLGLVYSIVESDRKDYLIDHSASIVLINPAGKLAAMFRPRVAPGEVPHVDMQTMVSDFAHIVRLTGE